MKRRTVFLVDVDNTLFDNDRLQEELSSHLEDEYGKAARDRYWTLFEELRRTLGYADYLGALQRYRKEKIHDPRLLRMSSWLVDYPFDRALHPRAIEVLDHLKSCGEVVILSDGDAVFQPRKIERSGLWKAADGRVLIYIHKEEMLSDIEERHPADHYVLIDDKLKILTAVKSSWKDRVTTVFPRQGHYATDPRLLAAFPAPDLAVSHISDLMDLDLETLLSPERRTP